MTNQLYDKPSVEMLDENSKLIKLVPTKSLTVLSVQCLSESSGDTDKLSVDALERDYFVEGNALGHSTGAYSRSDSVGQHDVSGGGLNSQIDDKTRQALIASNLVDACQSLIRVKNDLAQLDKLNRNVLNEILYCALSFMNKPKDSAEYEIMASHFKLLVGEALVNNFCKGNSGIDLASMTRNVAVPSTSSQIPIDQFRIGNDEETVKPEKKLSRFAKLFGFFKKKPKNETTKPKMYRWKKLLNRLNCFSSTQ